MPTPASWRQRRRSGQTLRSMAFCRWACAAAVTRQATQTRRCTPHGVELHLRSMPKVCKHYWVYVMQVLLDETGGEEGSKTGEMDAEDKQKQVQD